MDTALKVRYSARLFYAVPKTLRAPSDAIAIYHRIYSRNIKLRSLVRERTMPTERQPLIGEVSDKCCG
jgi:hypothetical protein